LLLMLLAGACITPGAHAQTSYGTIVGTVNDSSGASVIGATVALKNNGTDATQTTTTAAGGTYSFVNLNPGAYSVSVTQQGFKSSTNDHVDVQIGGTTRVNVSLEIGDVAQTVTVSSSTTELQSDSASLSGVIEGQQVLEAPLNGRNVNNLLDFVPGVTPGGGTQGSTMANGGSGNFQAGGQTQAIAYGNYQIGGAFSGQSLFFIDGVGSNIAENNVNTLVPTQDAVQEFRVSTNNVSAQFGGYGGGVIQISTKSGTNEFHGNAYEYFRNTVLDANDWFSNHEGLGRSPLHQNQYGANLGGPAIKNKLFFFFSWEHESLISASPTSATVPTTAELAGDFSGDPQTIYDPTTGMPFPQNLIPAGRIDQTALKILQLETPNESRVIQKPFTTNFFASAPIEGYQDQYNARVDANVGKADTIFARYTFWNPHNGASDPFGTNTGAGPTGNYTQEGVLGDNHVFTPTLIADIRLSYLENYNFQYPLSEGFDMSSISPAYGTIQSESQDKEGLLPGLGIQNYGIGAELSQLYWNNNVWAVSGSATKIIGKHTIKAGGNWRQVLWENYSNSQGLGLNASPFYTSVTPSNDATTGNALASFLLGIPSSTGISSVGTWHAFLHNYGLFAEDTWQATPKLTVIAGLRWEQPGAYSEENNLDSILQPNAAVTVGGISSISNPVTGAAVPLTAQLAFVNSSQYHSRREEALHWKLFSPRLGFAYRADPRTVVRSGYGISFFPAEITADSPGNSPINSAGTSVGNTPGAPLLATIDNPLPNGINLPSGRTQAGLDAALGQGIGGRIPDQPYGYSQQWNLAVERAIDHSSTVVVAYAGSKGTHLILAQGYTGTGLNLNQLPDQYDSLGSALLTQVPNPFYGTINAGPYGSPTVAEGYLLEPHPQYTSVSQVVPRKGDSTYHALQVTYTRHFAHNGILQGAYTWSKLLSNTDNTSAFQDGQGGIGVVQDNTNLKAEKSLSQQDLANNLVINYGIDLPFGQGEKYLSSINGFANQVLGGWRVNGITTLRSGLPIALVANGNGLSQFGAGAIRPNYTAGCSKSAPGSPHSAARADMWFNTACFSEPDNYSFGNEPRVDPQLKTEGEDNWDFSVNKFFPLTERVKLKFTTEIFDLFNHAQFAEPNVGLGPSFGQITHQVNLPRTIQFALRVTF
jgi:outer membrane receptor protein involved in Fe transport